MNSENHDTPVTWCWTLGFAVVAALLAAAQRLIPAGSFWHPFNFAMIGALGLWGGARLRPVVGLLLPLAVWFGTDLYFYLVKDWPAFNPFVYCAFLVYPLLGLTVRRSRSIGRIALTGTAGSLVFFLITNFGVWTMSWQNADRVPPGHAFVTEAGAYNHQSVHYAADLKGLLACYAMGLPFYGQDAAGNDVPLPFGFLGNLLAGDLGFTAFLFGSHAVMLTALRRRAPVPVSR